MKRYNKKSPPHLMELETITAAMVYDLVEKLGTGQHGKFGIFSLAGTDAIRYRVCIQDKSDFEISLEHKEDEFELKSGDWIAVDGKIHRFTSCSSNFNGIPLLRVEQVYDWLLECTEQELKDHILVDNGVMFDGTREQFMDCFFSNANNNEIIHWCVQNKFTLKINGKLIKSIK